MFLNFSKHQKRQLTGTYWILIVVYFVFNNPTIIFEILMQIVMEDPLKSLELEGYGDTHKKFPEG